MTKKDEIKTLADKLEEQEALTDEATENIIDAYNNIDWDALEFEPVEDDSEALKWEPVEVGDTLQGVYLETQENADGYLFHILEDQDGQRVSAFGRTVLNSQLEKVAPGTPIKIKYNGQRKNKTGHNYYDYKVYVPKVPNVPA